MARHILTIRELGENASWLLVQQALGMPDPKLQTDFMAERVVLLVFIEPSLPERLCVSAAVRQMSGHVVYEGGGLWHAEVGDFQEQLLPIFGYYVNCIYTYGIPVRGLESMEDMLPFPHINAGSCDAHPAHALADIACMLRNSRYLENVTCAYMGNINGTLRSLMEATAWFPFSLRVALPESVDPAPVLEAAARLESDISLCNSPEDALEGANYVMAGSRMGLSENEQSRWRLTPARMAHAADNARIMLSASPVRAIGVEKSILNCRTALLVQQAEFRLRIHKRMLHWVYLDNEKAI